MKRDCLIKTAKRHAERVLIIHHPENGEVKVSLILIAFSIHSTLPLLQFSNFC